ncbi:hypothetical protein ASZ78_016358 [Callipepla squamata]|uniref:CD99 antigen-like protein 2 n=1 Tax=Callipepla squamata TaxID=9009 RepID=A0A226N7F4_CALSU|nr:hypothetical protein ASZ78_016358 [Callipepla squamata]
MGRPCKLCLCTEIIYTAFSKRTTVSVAGGRTDGKSGAVCSAISQTQGLGKADVLLAARDGSGLAKSPRQPKQFECRCPATLRVEAADVAHSNSHDTSLLAGHGDDPGEFSLEDALGPILQLDLADFFDTPVEPTRPARPTARPFPRPGKPDNGFWDIVRTTTTKRPKTTQAPRRHNPGKDPLDLDLADALGDGDDVRGRGQAGLRPGEGLSDSDLESIVNDGYSPDKKKGTGGNTDSQDNRVETGTIAGIASALAMALVGAVSSYISYQQKKFCFSIERKQPWLGVGGHVLVPSAAAGESGFGSSPICGGWRMQLCFLTSISPYCCFSEGLNAEYVKGENMEAVVSEEPQVKYSVLETQSAEPPKHDGAKV